MLKKEKITIEYQFNKVSKTILWKCLSSSNGLGEWFADKVDDTNNEFVFTWENHHQTATLMTQKEGVFVRFHWNEEPEDTYFEFSIHTIELTGDVGLTITDFVEVDERDDAIRLWNAQIDNLRRAAGMSF